MHSAERFFLIGALSDYSGHRKLDADDVTREVALMRAAFTNLGYTEIEPPEEDRRGPVELEQALEDWVTEREATSRDGDRASLVVYYTGHGVVSTPNTLFLPSADATPPPPGKPVTPSARFVPAANLASWALNTHVLDDFLLIVDTCMSGTAGLNIVKLEAEASGTSGRGPNLWVISAARRLENAEVGKFAEAFTASLASAEGNQEQIDITKFVGVINEHLDTASQQANLIALTNNTCGLLLDPHHMPRQLPDGLVSWVGSARGVEAAEQPGWYFTGRREALAAIDEHLGDDRPGPLVITGSRGSGKTALLRWTQITTSRELWAAVPPVAQRRTGRVRSDLAVDYLPLSRLTPMSTVLGHTATETQRSVLLVDVSATEPPTQDVLDQVVALAQRPGLRVVVAGPPSVLASVAAARRVDLDDYAADLPDYLRFRATRSPDTRSREAELARRFDEVTDQCCESFQAAAHAAGALVDTGDVDQAVPAVGRVLTGYCEQELATDHSHSRVSQLLSPLALRKPLTVRQWARLATALSNQPCTEDDVLVVVGRLGRYLTHDEEKDTWLLRFSLQGGAYRTSDATLLPALLGLIPTNGGHERHWDSADHVYLELLAGVAARPQGVDLLDDASFLLAAPSSAIGEALRAVGKEPLLEVWHRIRHSSLSRSSRSILLALHAHAAGLTHLAEQVRVTGVPVEVQRYRPCPEDTDEITLVAVDSGSDAAHCVTVHDDEVVTIWSPSSFEVAHRLGHADIRDISACAVTTVDGEPVVVLGTHTGLVAIWDCARKELIAVEAAERIEAVSVDTDLRVAALGDGVLHMIDGRDGRALQEPVDVPDAKAVCIARTVLSVATETGLLHLWNRNSTARPTVRTAYRGGYSSALALSYDGISAAWMHDEVLWVDAPGRPAYALGRLNGVESLAVGDRWVAAVRATQDNSVRVWHLSTGQSFDVPLHEAGVAAAFTRADLLLVTTRSALVSLRLG